MYIYCIQYAALLVSLQVDVYRNEEKPAAAEDKGITVNTDDLENDQHEKQETTNTVWFFKSGPSPVKITYDINNSYKVLMYFMQTRPPVPLSWLVALSDSLRSSQRVRTIAFRPLFLFVLHRLTVDASSTKTLWNAISWSPCLWLEWWTVPDQPKLAVLLFMKTL